jgi:ADP-ribosylglycohydrolase
MKRHTILGAIAGDVFGSVYEFDNIKTVDFNLLNNSSRYTDDTILTIAVADAVLNGLEFNKTIAKYARKYPNTYGPGFIKWFNSPDLTPNNSFGNGSAMRVSPIGFAFKSINEVLIKAEESALASHAHHEAVKGAQAIASCVFLAKIGKSKPSIKKFVENTFNYDLDFTIDKVRDDYSFSATCQDTVPHAIVAFLDSVDYESAIKLAISLGGDSDTIACMTGGIAAAYYKDLPKELADFVLARLPKEFRSIISLYDQFVIQ